ncbi:CVNH domain-containing protein [Lichenihabitans sp. PAMC28606]|uniref:CVNH domain-containing protein n=1 Tax=Lichenihabitans sp. PAMC28606 TaxID=2880932 RepID=UPI001D0BC7A5|nr:CVNH domain-containing protein [Lichenihabitans sp. PAMC28606]UDL96086.1 CVNH domain-containing protein [Lichenihabitans sp. PAMC28606]
MTKLWLALPVLCLLPLGGASAQVSGSYQQSCRNVQQDGNSLTADCKVPGGGTVRSTLDLGRCRGQGVANSYGRLACGNVQGSAAPGGRSRNNGDNGNDGGYDGGGRRRNQDSDYVQPGRGGYGQPQGYGYGQPGPNDDDYAPRRPRRYYQPDDE